MSEPSSDQVNARQIQAMFSRIVPRYDRMNRWMTLGLDGRWRRAAARKAEPEDGWALDLGAGTGDLSRALHQAGARRVVSADFSRRMLVAGQAKAAAGHHRQPSWLLADAPALPFADDTFDAVVSGFLLRNLVDLPAGLSEMIRVLKPGGRLVALDITHPPAGPLAAITRGTFHRLVTPLAGRLSGDRDAYRYLAESLSGFPEAPALAALIAEAGGQEAGFQRLGGGAMALHWARKAAGSPGGRSQGSPAA